MHAMKSRIDGVFDSFLQEAHCEFIFFLRVLTFYDFVQFLFAPNDFLPQNFQSMLV